MYKAANFSYRFLNDADNILEFLNEVTRAVLSHYGEAIPKLILSSLKHLLVESMTNSIKHSGIMNCNVSMYFENKYIEIIKEDDGKPFTHHLCPQWPLSDDHITDHPLLIYKGNMDKLLAKVESPCKISFYAETEIDTELDFEKYQLRNFGLLIITKCSKSFTYEYFPEKNINRFSMILSLE